MKRAGIVAALIALGGCNGSSGPAPAPSASVSAAPSASAAATGPLSGRLEAILTAEHRRVTAEILPADQQSRDVIVRRAAARALSRIGGESARDGLLRALADEDEEVVAWGAYGLGFFCKGHEKDNVSALVARTLTREVGRSKGATVKPATSAAAQPAGEAPRLDATRLDATAVIARAIGRCAAEESEPTLVAWLAGPRDRAIAAAYALGDVAEAKQKLREETLVALLNLAAGSAAAPPVPEALFAIGRLERVPLTVVDRIREVASARLAAAGEARLFAVRALGRGGDDAAFDLERVLKTPGAFTAAERAEAARGLKRLGRVGQRVLAGALSSLAPSSDPVALTALVGDDFGVLQSALDALDTTAGESGAPAGSRKALAELASLPLPPGAPATIARRISWIRCGAAKILAGDDIRDKRLVGCDVTAQAAAPVTGEVDAGAGEDGGAPASPSQATGSIGARALVAVLDRDEITGARLTAYRAIAKGGDVRSREAALELIGSHDEIEGAAALLTDALAAKEPGIVATAADVLAKQPQRAGAEPPPEPRKGKKKRRKPVTDEAPPARSEALPPSPALVKALLAVLARPEIPDDPEIAGPVIDAVAALALKEAKPRVDELCRSPYPTTREHAQKALALLGDKKTCEPPVEGGMAPAELMRLVQRPTTLELDTDVGALKLTLDPTLTPVIVTRVVELARDGYYNEMIVHRVAHGFVTQFGAPYGDGYGGPPGRPAVRCETSPLPFAPLTVGVALDGRDTGSSQLFVMHGRYPHLDGRYAIIGAAEGPWAAFVDGDVIHKITVKP